MAPSTRRSLIFLGIFGAVLLALFVAGVVSGAGGGGPGSGCSPGQREAWRARLLRAEPVARGQLSGCTTVPGRFIVTGSCQLRIAAADARLRRLVLEAIDPIRLELAIDADGRRIPMRAELAANQREEILIGEDGQILRISCRTGGTCRATIQ